MQYILDIFMHPTYTETKKTKIKSWMLTLLLLTGWKGDS